MQDLPWQELIVGICVLAAVAFLARRWLFPSKKSAACGGCGGCDKTSDASCTNPEERNS